MTTSALVSFPPFLHAHHKEQVTKRIKVGGGGGGEDIIPNQKYFVPEPKLEFVLPCSCYNIRRIGFKVPPYTVCRVLKPRNENYSILLVIKPLPSVSFTMTIGKSFLRIAENLLDLKDSVPMQDSKNGQQKRKKDRKDVKFL